MLKDNTKIYCALCKCNSSAKQAGRTYVCNNCHIIWSTDELGMTKETRIKLIPQKIKELKAREKAALKKKQEEADERRRNI